MEDLPEESFTEGNLRLVKLVNTVSHQRLKTAMKILSNDFGGSTASFDANGGPSNTEHARSLVRVAFGEEDPRFAESPTVESLKHKWKNAKLDDAQRVRDSDAASILDVLRLLIHSGGIILLIVLLMCERRRALPWH